MLQSAIMPAAAPQGRVNVNAALSDVTVGYAADDVGFTPHQPLVEPTSARILPTPLSGPARLSQRPTARHGAF